MKDLERLIDLIMESKECHAYWHNPRKDGFVLYFTDSAPVQVKTIYEAIGHLENELRPPTVREMYEEFRHVRHVCTGQVAGDPFEKLGDMFVRYLDQAEADD